MKKSIVFIILAIFVFTSLAQAQNYDEVTTEGEDKSKIEIVPAVNDDMSKDKELQLDLEKVEKENPRIKKDADVNVKVKKVDNVKSSDLKKEPLFRHKRDKNKFYIIILLLVFAVAAS